MNERESSSPIADLVDTGCLPADPVPWLLDSSEPYAVWITLTAVLGLPADDRRAVAARAGVVANPDVLAFIGELPAAVSGRTRSGHHSPLFLPNRLNLLADMGVRAGDDPRLDAVLESLLVHRDRNGRFRAPGATRPKPDSGSLSCDNNAIAEVLLRFGLGEREEVKRAVSRVAADAAPTLQGRAWCCVPVRRGRLLGGTRLTDTCPQITLEGLRVLGRIESPKRTRDVLAAARTPLELWRRRTEERPYEFGHGYQFKTVKWPSFWYDVLAVVDTIGRFPEVWRDSEARETDRRALAELAACLIAYNVGEDGLVTPRRVHPGYERFSFGRKTAPSPFATARLMSALVRVADLAEQIALVDVEALPSSRGAGERSVPPEGSARPAAPAFCPVPVRRSYESKRILPRVLARHHLDAPWEPQSPESIAADVVGLPAGEPSTPYLSLAARIPGFQPTSLDHALDERRSLVRMRCMRGRLYAVRRDLVTTVHAASSRQVVRFARDFARQRGVERDAYARLAERVLEACAEQPLTRRQLRDRIRPTQDLAAVITLMVAERLLWLGPPADGRFGRQPTYAPFDQALPDIDLAELSEDEARPLLLRAYVRGFGPVTRKDAAWWTGMDLKRVRRSFEALEDELVQVAFDGGEETWLMHAADADELERASLVDTPNVALLPANDPLLVSYMDRSRFVDDIARPFVLDSAGNATAVAVVNGRVAAVWDVSSASEGGREILVFPTAPLEASVAQKIEQRARDIGRVLLGSETPVRYVVGMKSLTERPIGAYLHPLR